jgi:hypothetical protein
MSTIELVDPELRAALALWPLLPLTAESLTRRRANALELIAAVPQPNLPDDRHRRDPWRECVWRKADRVLTYRRSRPRSHCLSSYTSMAGAS